MEQIEKRSLEGIHDSKWPGHLGTHRTKEIIKRSYYWQNIRRDIAAYVRTCLICQQDKVEQAKPIGLLEPLLIFE